MKQSKKPRNWRPCVQRIIASLAASLLGALPLAAGAADDAPPQGALGRALFGDDFGKESGLRLGGWLQVGYAVNNHSDPNGPGLANSPVVIARDEGVQLNQLSLYIEKDIKTNIIPRVTPTPAPMPQEYSWGFKAMAYYGRDAQPVQMFGWDSQLAANRPGNQDPQNAGAFRQNFITYPEFHLNFYMPWWQGMSLMIGNFMSPIANEIGFAVEPTPNIFYTRTYALEAAPIDHTGALLAANLVRSQSWLLGGEFGIVNGWSNFKDNNNSKTYLGALRFRTADMKNWVDYEIITGNEQTDPNKINNSTPASAGDTANFPVTRIVSTANQNRTEQHLTWTSEFAERWKSVIELTYGQQKGDPTNTTFFITGQPFSGATYSGLNGQLQYKIYAKVAVAGRLETFRDRDGFALFPNTATGPNSAVAGDFNAATIGVQWRPQKNLLMRPELRYDWQSNNNGQKAFAGGTKENQLLFAVDLVMQY
jgi:hypothetical protein